MLKDLPQTLAKRMFRDYGIESRVRLEMGATDAGPFLYEGSSFPIVQIFNILELCIAGSFLLLRGSH